MAAQRTKQLRRQGVYPNMFFSYLSYHRLQWWCDFMKQVTILLLSVPTWCVS